MKNKFFSKVKDEIMPKELGEAIQHAIEIEIATIPTYLYTYYSINRFPNQKAICSSLTQKLIKVGKTLECAQEIALDFSAKIMVFANKTGALIMSVAIEEMLHMALSSNLKQALAGLPLLAGKSPNEWPTSLPGHLSTFKINRAKLSLNQLSTFINIESPKPICDSKTIGEFYDMIKKCIDKNDLQFKIDLPQLINGKSYYAQNNIDTVYYDKTHNPQFTNQDDSGDLIFIKDKTSANKAIECIVDQGEGKVINGEIQTFDDPSKKEKSHYEKFKEIHLEYQLLNLDFKKYFEVECNDDKEVDYIGQYFVKNIANNPLTKDYPAHIASVSDLLNAIYTYIFVMMENCYVLSGNTQWEVFMFGMHKSMIFILNSISGDIMNLCYTAPNGISYAAAPTFENYSFNLLSSPKAQMINLFNTAVGIYPAISYLEPRIHDLPDVLLSPYIKY